MYLSSACLNDQCYEHAVSVAHVLGWRSGCALDERGYECYRYDGYVQQACSGSMLASWARGGEECVISRGEWECVRPPSSIVFIDTESAL